MRGECVPAVTMVSIVWLKGLVPSPHPLFHPPIVSPDCSGSPAVFVTAFSGCETVKSAKNLDLLLPSRPWALRATADLQLLSVEPREGRGSRLSGYLSFLSPSRTSGSARFAVSFGKNRHGRGRCGPGEGREGVFLSLIICPGADIHHTSTAVARRQYILCIPELTSRVADEEGRGP